jgi:hypothetical protein
MYLLVIYIILQWYWIITCILNMHFNRFFKNVSLVGKNPTNRKILQSRFQVDEILDVFHLQVNEVLKCKIYFFKFYML